MYIINDKTEVAEMLHDMCINGFPFGSDHDCDYYDWEAKHSKWCVAHQTKIHSGATKIVIDCDQFDFVIKFGYRSIEGKNYEDLEYEKYCELCEDRYDTYVAALELIDCFNGINMYAQERCRCDYDEIYDVVNNYMLDNYEQNDDESQEDYLDRVSAYTDEAEGDDICAALFADCGQFDGLDGFLWFCLDHEINDLHKGNFGRNKKGYWVLIDYSGFVGYDE